MAKLKIFITFTALFLFCSSCSSATAQSIEWRSMKEAQKLASENGKKVMIFAEAKWCGYCKKMNKEVFTQKSVADSLQKYFYPVRLDIESGKEIMFNGQEYTQQALARKFQVYSTPTTIFLTSDGVTIGVQPGFLPTDMFNKLVAYVGSAFYEKMPFETYLEKNS